MNPKDTDIRADYFVRGREGDIVAVRSLGSVLRAATESIRTQYPVLNTHRVKSLLVGVFEDTQYSVLSTTHSTFRIPHSDFRIPYSVFRIPYSVFRIPYFTFHISHFTFHISHYFNKATVSFFSLLSAISKAVISTPFLIDLSAPPANKVLTALA